MKTRTFTLNGITVIINIDDKKAYVTYFKEGIQIIDIDLITEENQKLIEACIEVILK